MAVDDKKRATDDDIVSAVGVVLTRKGRPRGILGMRGVENITGPRTKPSGS